MASRDLPSVGIRTCSIDPAAPCGAEALRTVKQAGFDLAELNFNRGGADAAYADRGQADAVRGCAEELGLELVAHAPDTFWLTDPDPSTLARTIAECRRVLAGCAAYGARVVTFHACPGQPAIPGRQADQVRALSEALRALALECDRLAIHLAVETMIPGRVTSSMDNLAAAVDAADSPRIGICVDTNHANLDQDLFAAIRAAGPRIREFHVNDNHGVCEEHLLPYDGDIDWPRFAALVAEIGYRGPMILEPGRAASSDDTLLPQARAVADRLLAAIRAARANRPSLR